MWATMVGMSIGTDPIVAIADELGRLGHRLDGIAAELLSIQGRRSGPGGAGPPIPATAPAASFAPIGPMGGPLGPPAPPPLAQPYPGADPFAPAPVPGLPPAGWHPIPQFTPWPGPVAPPVAPPVATRRSWSALSGARLMAWTGGAVTLLGVVLLLVLAASQGWFTPEARVGVGAVLGAALIGVALWLHRRESARTGATALAATGFGTLYLVVAGSTFVLGLPEIPAVLFALVVATGGLILADQWRSPMLAGGVVVGGAVLAPFLVGGVLLVALLLALQVGAAPVALRRGWPWVAALAATGPVLHGMLLSVFEDDRSVLVAAVLAVALIGLGTAALAVGRLPDVAVAGLGVASVLPALVAAGDLGGWGGAGVAAAAGILVLALVGVPGAGQVVRFTAAGSAAVALFEATAIALDGSTRTSVLLGQAVALAVWAAASRRRFPLVLAGGFGLVGVLAAASSYLPAVVVFPVAPFVVDGVGRPGERLAGALVGLAVLAFAVVALVAAGRVGLVRPDAGTAWLWAPLGTVGLFGAAGLVVALALLIAPDRTGFTVGHAVVTVSWTLAALVLLARGLRRPALRVTGLVLVAAAVAKLVLFDLTALDGIGRVAAFLGAGLVLLAVGTRYARLVAETEQRASS